MKKLASLLLATTLLAGAAGCSPAAPSASKDPGTAGSTPPAPVQSAAPSATNSDLKIAVMLSGPPTDGGYCQQGKEAGDAVGAEFGITVNVIECTGAENVKAEAENMAAEGYKIIFGQGGEYATSFAEIAKDYPDTWFVTNGGEVVSANQFPMCMSTEQGGYVCGVIAGMMTKTGVIGKIAGADFPSFIKPGVGFELGAKSVKPDIDCKQAVLSATNVNEAYETAMGQIQSGADFMFANANEGTDGSVKAVSESEGVYTFGVFGDFTSKAPDRVIGNSLVDTSKAYVETAKAIINGEITEPSVMFLGMKEGVISFTWNEDLKATLPADVVKAAEDAIQGFKDGTIVIPNEYEISEQGLK